MRRTLLRYSPSHPAQRLGVEGQERLLRSRALVIGAGGLTRQWRCTWAAPVKFHITLVDHDHR